MKAVKLAVAGAQCLVLSKWERLLLQGQRSPESSRRALRALGRGRSMAARALLILRQPHLGMGLDSSLEGTCEDTDARREVSWSGSHPNLVTTRPPFRVRPEGSRGARPGQAAAASSQAAPHLRSSAPAVPPDAQEAEHHRPLPGTTPRGPGAMATRAG